MWGDWTHLADFPPFHTREAIFVTTSLLSCEPTPLWKRSTIRQRKELALDCIPAHRSPYEKGSAIIEKNLEILSFYSRPLFRKVNNNLDSYLPSECISFLNWRIWLDELQELSILTILPVLLQMRTFSSTITETRLFKYIENFTTKKGNFFL